MEKFYLIFILFLGYVEATWTEIKLRQ